MCCDADEGLLCQSVQCYHHRGHRYHICITKIAHAAWLSNSQVRAISISNRPPNSINSALKCNLNSASKCNLNLASKSPFSIRKLFSIPFGLQVPSQLGLQMQSQFCNVFFSNSLSNRRIIPHRNFSLKSSQPINCGTFRSAIYSAELSRNFFS